MLLEGYILNKKKASLPARTAPLEFLSPVFLHFRVALLLTYTLHFCVGYLAP